MVGYSRGISWRFCRGSSHFSSLDSPSRDASLLISGHPARWMASELSCLDLVDHPYLRENYSRQVHFSYHSPMSIGPPGFEPHLYAKWCSLGSFCCIGCGGGLALVYYRVGEYLRYII